MRATQKCQTCGSDFVIVNNTKQVVDRSEIVDVYIGLQVIYDISRRGYRESSTLQGTENYCSCVQYVETLPYKNDYFVLYLFFVSKRLVTCLQINTLRFLLC